MCTNPKRLIKEGYYKETNYNGLKGEKYSIDTFSKCGVCEQCLSEKANSWVVRNTYEAEQHGDNISFVTLTYKDNPEFLIKKDLQDFLKRFRRTIEYHGFKGKIRYFACGEYGTLRGRPHYHIIIYGWKDDKAKFIGLNKKNNLIYKSEIIEKTWGKGITCYQEFNSKEIPYISLYTSPAENFSKAYKISLENAKEKLKTYKKMEKQGMLKGETFYNAMNVLETLIKEKQKEKEKYILIKEFNIWSKAIGWETFYDKYAKSEKYVFTEYIEDCQFPTPNSWVKKLANQGDMQAIEEMEKRAKLFEKHSEEEERTLNRLKKAVEHPKNVIEFLEKKDMIEKIL